MGNRRQRGSGLKTDNAPAARAAKLEIRRNVMAAIGAPVHVFDAFAGTGELHRAVWKDAASYVGCDKRYLPDGRKMFVADNRRVLRAIRRSKRSRCGRYVQVGYTLCACLSFAIPRQRVPYRPAIHRQQ